MRVQNGISHFAPVFYGFLKAKRLLRVSCAANEKENGPGRSLPFCLITIASCLLGQPIPCGLFSSVPEF